MSETTYTVRNAWGDPLFPTTDAEEAAWFSERGCEVTAVTENTQ